jgi:hypothetical protein
VIIGERLPLMLDSKTIASAAKHHVAKQIDSHAPREKRLVQ